MSFHPVPSHLPKPLRPLQLEALQGDVPPGGTHLIVDLWGACHLDDLTVVENALRASVTAAGATLLHIHLHHFSPTGGISGVAVLAESHISVHTWPERAYAAFDVFMCGRCDPRRALPVLEEMFQPKRTVLYTQLRGSFSPDAGESRFENVAARRYPSSTALTQTGS